jgi:hypothetical protein
MPFIGNKPSAVPLTSADIADGIITSAKIVDATITNSDVASSIITGQTAETSIAGGDSVLIYDDSASALRKMTRTNFVSGIGGANTPAFSVTTTTAVTVGGGASTKVTWNTEHFDTDSAFDSTTNYRFTVPAGQAGKYMFHVSNGVFGSISGRTSQLRFYKNGTYDDTKTYNVATFGTTHVALIATAMFDLSVADYIEIYIYSDNDAPKNTVDNNDGSGCQWFGYKLI